jgi:HAD superfamily hydrolase (TIGR01509 family)
MIKAIIFDFFGVLRPDVLYTSYNKFGGDAQEDEAFIHATLYESHIGKIQSSAPVFAEKLGVSVDDWLQAITEDVNDQDLLTYIKTLRKDYKTGVLSNVGTDGLRRYFSQKQLDEYFDAVIVSAEIGYAKPQPEAYRIAAQTLGVQPEECVFVDDRAGYCEGASATGMHTILYTDRDLFKQQLEALLADS